MWWNDEDLWQHEQQWNESKLIELLTVDAEKGELHGSLV